MVYTIKISPINYWVYKKTIIKIIPSRFQKKILRKFEKKLLINYRSNTQMTPPSNLINTGYQIPNTFFFVRDLVPSIKNGVFRYLFMILSYFLELIINS